ncbi:FAD-binding protein [Lujinxingia sediminis]|uniref:FAD-binding protein n=1 Tax=Lujinxingia sediminis TaxID=2480984 RepID=A0ABY0CN98_9DELT|nr:FAD-dependent monooxygenase [Lujinxingia sediminis]RVU41421.1 FAD-binding protein [Lujinxingia sediminis]
MRDIAIIGAGIGGLTAAHALLQAGASVRIFERAPQLRALGAGITMQGNAMEALASLGLAERVRNEGHTIARAQIATWQGEPLQTLDLRTLGPQVAWPGVAIHRRRLIHTLAEDLQNVIAFDAGATHIEHDDDAVHVTFEDGSQHSFAALIGCDGLHSAVRRSLRADEALRYDGYTSWRGVASMPATGLATTEMWGAGRRFGLVPIANDEVYWFAVADAPRNTALEGPTLARLQQMFDGWASPVADILNATNPADIIATDCLDRPPITTWGQGRVTLLGDAAHPMMPNLGQGGCQAVESAVVLGRALRSTPDLVQALRRYERQRTARANLFVKRSFETGRIAQWRNPLARGIRNLGMRLIPQSFVERALIEQYGFEAWFRSVSA